MLIGLVKKLLRIANIHPAEIDRPIIILDIGCRWGFADKFIGCQEDFELYGFDPDIEECKRLKDLYNSPHIHLVPVGLAEHPGEKTLYITKEPACSSMYKPHKHLINANQALECARESGQRKVKTTTLDIWASKEGIKGVDYIKIDTQGSELDILKGAKKILKQVRFLEIEVEFNPIYEDQPLFSDVDSYLRKNGFELWALPNIVHYGNHGESDNVLSCHTIFYDHHRYEFESRGGQIFWADAIYVRKEIIDDYINHSPKQQLRRDYILAQTLNLLDLANRIQKSMPKADCRT